MGKQPSADERRKTQADELTQRVRAIVEEQRSFIQKAVLDAQGYVDGVTEQALHTMGSIMSVQAAMIEYLDELSTKRRDDVGAEVRIKSILEQNMAKAKEERAAREAANAAPADIAPETPAVAPAQSTGDA